MATPTRRATEADIIEADCERVQQAHWSALCEMQSEFYKVVDARTFDRWCRRVNWLFNKKMRRLN